MGSILVFAVLVFSDVNFGHSSKNSKEQSDAIEDCQ